MHILYCYVGSNHRSCSSFLVSCYSLSPDYNISHHSFFLPKKCWYRQVQTVDLCNSWTFWKSVSLTKWATAAWNGFLIFLSAANDVLIRVSLFGGKASLAGRIEVPSSADTKLQLGAGLSATELLKPNAWSLQSVPEHHFFILSGFTQNFMLMVWLWLSVFSDSKLSVSQNL